MDLRQRSTTPEDTASQLPKRTPRMRASAACDACHVRKLQCTNEGWATLCQRCPATGVECTWNREREKKAKPPKRPQQEDDKENGSNKARKRGRQLSNTSSSSDKYSPSRSPIPQPAPEDALDYRVLTPAIWSQIALLWQTHYSAELPFIHQPTFTKPLGSAATSEPNVRPAGSNLVLLGVLALTARFSRDLVDHHTPAGQSQQPMLASDYYAEAATHELRKYRVSDEACLDTVQGSLLLASYASGTCKPLQAWRLVHVAQTDAQWLRMHRQEHDETAWKVTTADVSQFNKLADQDHFVMEETKRRLMWSCINMDIFTTHGSQRPPMSNMRHFNLQLPASEDSFTSGNRVVTRKLNERPDEFLERMKQAGEHHIKLEDGEHEGLVSRFERVVQLYGKVCHWTCLGGRRTRMAHAPWKSQSTFFQLFNQCKAFTKRLPAKHALTRENTKSLTRLRTASPYVLMHLLHLTCIVMLHREYVPYTPVNLDRPRGPIDPPRIDDVREQMTPGWWEGSADQCFSAARSIIDLCEDCQEEHALPETPITVFALYTAAFTGLWCQEFPNMDLQGRLCDRPDRPGTSGHEKSEKAKRMLVAIAPRLPNAATRLQALDRFKTYFQTIKLQHRQWQGDHRQRSMERQVNLYGGLEDYREMEDALHMVSNGSSSSASSIRDMGIISQPEVALPIEDQMAMTSSSADPMAVPSTVPSDVSFANLADPLNPQLFGAYPQEFSAGHFIGENTAIATMPGSGYTSVPFDGYGMYTVQDAADSASQLGQWPMPGILTDPIEPGWHISATAAYSSPIPSACGVGQQQRQFFQQAMSPVCRPTIGSINHDTQFYAP